MRMLIVIPSRYEPRRLAALVRVVSREADTLVLDNGHELRNPIRVPVRIVDSRGLGIYAMWNRGWASARHEGYEAIALINDDIRVLPGAMSLLSEALASDPTIGVVSPDRSLPLSAGLPQTRELQVVRDPSVDRTMAGFIFVARTSMFEEPPFDEGFHWWFGDDAFDRRVREAGYGIARYLGLPVEHESDSEKDNWARRPELRKLVQQDLARWVSMQPVPV